MTRRKSVIAINVLFALAFAAFAAFAAANASAEDRAYACEDGGAHQFSDEHCLTPNTTTGEFHHQLLPSPTGITATNAGTASGTTAAEVSKLKGKISGVVTEIQCTGAAATGSLKNKATFVEGTGFIHYTGCSVTKPAGKKCLVKEGKVDTEELEAETLLRAGTNVLVNPVIGEIIAIITIEGCEIAALNERFPVKGLLVATMTGATATTTHAGITGQGTFTFGGNAAGLEGALTIKTEVVKDAVVLTP
jgi:hypothetical protein